MMSKVVTAGLPCSLLALAMVAVCPKARAADTPCTSQRLTRFIEQAQRGEQTARSEGRALASCTGLSAEAVQWLAYLMAVGGDRDQALRLDEAVAVLPPRRGPSRVAVIARARSGDYRELWAKVDGAAPGYATDPEALLALGRVLARKSFFNRSRDMYVTYLRLRPQDLRAEAEYLYTFLWEKDSAGAEARFLAAARRPVPPELAAAVERGLVVVRLRAGDGSSLSKASSTSGASAASGKNAEPSHGMLKGRLSGTSFERRYHRRSVEADYHGPLDARVAAHRMRYSVLGEEETAFTEAELGFAATVGPVEFGAHGGYFAAGDGHYFGDVALALTLPWSAPALVRSTAERRPLVLERGLPKDAVDLMVDRLGLGFDFGRYLSVDSALSKEQKYPASERHALLARLPLRGDPSVPKDVVGAAEWLAVRLPLTLEIRPYANPNYDAPARTETFGLGLEWERQVTPRLGFGASGDYQLARLVGRGVLSERRNVAFATTSLKAGWQVTRRMRLSFEGRVAWSEDEAWLYAQGLGTAAEVVMAHQLP